MILLYLLGYVWSGLTTIPGLLLFLLAKMLGMVTSTTTYGPAIVVRLRGRWADWMQTPNKNGYTFYGHTVGPFVFLYRFVDEKELEHESRHVWQQMVLGPVNLVVYPVSWLWGLARTRSFFLAYRQVWQERDARRAAGQGEDE